MGGCKEKFYDHVKWTECDTGVKLNGDGIPIIKNGEIEDRDGILKVEDIDYVELLKTIAWDDEWSPRYISRVSIVSKRANRRMNYAEASDNHVFDGDDNPKLIKHLAVWETIIDKNKVKRR